jgi:glutathione synthase/RimK-type ligase-like ATP-grasp enzyme
MTLLLAGGHDDPNLTVLADAVRKANVEALDLRLPAAESPEFCWDPQGGVPEFGGRKLQATCAFIRHDVFGGMRDPRPEVTTRAYAWYQTVMGWLWSQPGIRLFNRGMTTAATNKPAALVFAHEAGLRIPPTMITNQAGDFSGKQLEAMIAKPVSGGDYCYSLAEALAKTDLRSGLAAMPAIVQKRLVPPEVRIYVIGRTEFAVEMRSSSLDYRVNQDVELILLPKVPQEVSRLRMLMSRLGLDFGAADFKTDADTGELVFLELNTSPMFARFDQASNGGVCAAIIQELTTA